MKHICTDMPDPNMICDSYAQICRYAQMNHISCWGRANLLNIPTSEGSTGGGHHHIYLHCINAVKDLLVEHTGHRRKRERVWRVSPSLQITGRGRDVQHRRELRKTLVIKGSTVYTQNVSSTLDGGGGGSPQMIRILNGGDT